MTHTKERPIIFSGPMVRAIFDGRKTQTRRIIKPQMPKRCVISPAPWRDDFSVGGHDYRCPYGLSGSRLWVRETWAENHGTAGGIIYRADHGGALSVYKANLQTGNWDVAVSRWRPSIFMPRSASRILLDVTSVRVERLQDISEEDARAEGYDKRSHHFPIGWFQDTWENVNGAGSWDANPWVWVISFKRLSPTPTPHV